MSDKKATFFLVWNGAGSPTYRHETKQSAEREADRLARLNRGVNFFVLQSSSERVVDDLRVIEHDLEELPF